LITLLTAGIIHLPLIGHQQLWIWAAVAMSAVVTLNSALRHADNDIGQHHPCALAPSCRRSPPSRPNSGIEIWVKVVLCLRLDFDTATCTSHVIMMGKILQNGMFKVACYAMHGAEQLHSIALNPSNAFEETWCNAYAQRLGSASCTPSIIASEGEQMWQVSYLCFTAPHHLMQYSTSAEDVNCVTSVHNTRGKSKGFNCVALWHDNGGTVRPNGF